MENILINDTLLVFASVLAITAFGMYAEKKWKWAGILSGMGVSIFIAVILVTIHILPTASSAYDIVYDYVMPLAIPMVLVSANIVNIVKNSGKAFILMNVACVAAVIGSIVMGFALKNVDMFSNDIAGYVAMEAGVCTGGTMNQAAMAETFNVAADIRSAAAVGANLVAVLFLVVVGILPNLKVFKKNFKHPHMDKLEAHGNEETDSTAVVETKNGFSVFGYAKLFTFSFAVFGVSTLICGFTGELALPTVLSMIVSNQFLVEVVITVAFVSIFKKTAESMSFGQDIGNFMLLIFMTVMGTGASVFEVIKIAPWIVVGEIIILIFLMGITLGVAKIFKMNLEDALISINASYGGPSTVSAYVGSKNWKDLMAPGILIGVYGYIIGNILGIFAGNIFL